jgi:ribose transport system substrate-binding protein
MRTHRLVKFASAFALVLATNATGVPAATSEKPITIGITVYDMSSWCSWGKLGVDKMAAVNSDNILWTSANNDVPTQLSQIDSFIGKKVDAIIIDPVNSSTLDAEVKKAKAAGIPVFAVNQSIKSGALAGYFGPDDVQAGYDEMDSLGKLLHGKGNIVVTEGPIGGSAQIDRTEGINKALKKYPDIKVLSMQTANWKRSEALALMENWIARYGSQINGFVSENDDMAIGGITALKAKGLAGKIPVTAIDGIQDGMRYVKTGYINVTYLQNGALEFGEGVQLVGDYVRHHKALSGKQLIMPRVDKDNVEKYYTQLYGDPAAFIAKLPDIVTANLKSGKFGGQ